MKKLSGIFTRCIVLLHSGSWEALNNRGSAVSRKFSKALPGIIWMGFITSLVLLLSQLLHF